jgi:hypothetical protein
MPGPAACACCGGTRLSKLGEDVTETLEVVPRQWKFIQHACPERSRRVREKFSCRDCETIDQAPAPFHMVPRGWAVAGRRRRQPERQLLDRDRLVLGAAPRPGRRPSSTRPLLGRQRLGAGRPHRGSRQNAGGIAQPKGADLRAQA